MTAPKAPDNKTLVGLPNELKAILERPRTSPPPLPLHGTEEPQPSAAAGVAAQQPLPPKASMDRTLIGIPSEMQAALERALAEQAAGKAKARPAPRSQPAASVQVEVPPTASESVLRVHAVRTVGVSDAKDAESSPAPRRSAPAQQLPARPSPARRSAPSQLPPRPQARPQAEQPSSPPPRAQLPARGSTASQPPTRGQPTQAKRVTSSQPPTTSRSPGQSQLTSQSELLAQSQITAAPFLAPNAPLDWPPAQRRSDSGALPRSSSDESGAPAPPAAVQPATAASRRHASQPIAAEPSVIVTPDEPEPQPQLEGFEHHEAYRERPDEDDTDKHDAARAKRPAFTLPPGSAHTKTKRTKAVVERSPKRWPAIALIALAIVAFACVIVLRSPSLLPAPVAAMIVPAAKHGPGEGSSPRQATAASAAVAPVTAKPLETDTSAATNASLAPPSPTRPPASPPFTSGISAQLEKKAIERLLADDYPAAKQAYEKLRSAEPHRPEFGAMVEMLTRVTSGACGQPGQPACAGAVP